MNENPKANTLAFLFNLTEKLKSAFLTFLAIAILLYHLQYISHVWMGFFFLMLSILFFISAFHLKYEEEMKDLQGFYSFLVYAIIPKVIGISASILCVGCLYLLYQFDGYQHMLQIGTLCLFIAILIPIILNLTGIKLSKKYKRDLNGAFILVLVAAYFLLL